jgi:hypothetical protein
VFPITSDKGIDSIELFSTEEILWKDTCKQDIFKIGFTTEINNSDAAPQKPNWKLGGG